MTSGGGAPASTPLLSGHVDSWWRMPFSEGECCKGEAETSHFSSAIDSCHYSVLAKLHCMSRWPGLVKVWSQHLSAWNFLLIYFSTIETKLRPRFGQIHFSECWWSRTLWEMQDLGQLNVCEMQVLLYFYGTWQHNQGMSYGIKKTTSQLPSPLCLQRIVFGYYFTWPRALWILGV